MDDWIAYTVLGLCLGSVYAIAATGLVVTYTTSGIFNWAHGAIGTMSALVFWQLRTGWGLPTIVAVLLTVCVFAPLLGAAIETWIMRGLRGTTEITQLVVPVAVLLALNGTTVWIWFRDPNAIHRNDYWFGASNVVSVLGQPIRLHQLISVVLALLVAALLYVVLYRTRVGVTMRATVDDRNLLMMNGGRPDRMSVISWALGAALAGLAGVLLSPERGNLEVLALTLLVFNAYPAAIVGRLRSVPLAYAGGLAFGIAVNWWTKISLTPTGPRWAAFANLRPALPAVLLFIVLLLLPQDRLRGAAALRVREEFHVPTVRQAIVWGAALVGVVGALQALMVNSAVSSLANAMGLALMCLSLVLLTGYAGQINLALFSFAGIAVIAAWQFDVGPTGSAIAESMSVPAIVLAVAVCAVVGGLIALPAIRLRGLHLGLATFAFAVVVDYLVLRQSDPLHPRILGHQFELNLFTNNNLTVPRPHWFGIDFMVQRNFLLLLTLFFAIIGVALVALRRSAYGRMVVALKDSPAACATLGMNQVRLKLSVFMLSSGLAGFGGLMWAAQQRTISNSGTFGVFASLALFMLAVVGGIGYVSGALIAGVFFSVLGVVLPNVFEKLGADYPHLHWLFVSVLGDFSQYVSVAFIGIGLGKNPSGVAQDLIDAYRPLRKAPVAVALWLVAIVGLWALAWQDAIGNWTFTLIVLGSALVVPGLVMRTNRRRFVDELAELDGEDLGLVGIDRPLTASDRDRFDAALRLPIATEVR